MIPRSMKSCHSEFYFLAKFPISHQFKGKYCLSGFSSSNEVLFSLPIRQYSKVILFFFEIYPFRNYTQHQENKLLWGQRVQVVSEISIFHDFWDVKNAIFLKAATFWMKSFYAAVTQFNTNQSSSEVEYLCTKLLEPFLHVFA